MLLKDNVFKALFNQKGQTMIEYVLLIAFIAMVVYGTLLIFGPNLSNAYQNIVNQI